ALFVVSADPPLTEVEADFLTAVRSGIDRLFFVFNKVDYLNESERLLATSFFENILQEKVGAKDHSIFCVSARNGLDAKATENHELWTESGMEQLERYLIKFLAADKLTTLFDALKKQAADIIADCSMRLSLTDASLKMPLTDLEQRIETFDVELKRAETDRISTQDLLTGERKRCIAKLEQEAESLRLTSAEQLLGVVESSMIILDGDDISEKLILDSIAEELTSYFDSSSERLIGEFGILIKQTLRPHQLRVDELIEGIRKTASELFDIPYHAPNSDQAFETKRRPTWVLRKRVPSLPIIIPEETIDRLLPKAIRMTRLKKRLSRQVASLVHHNVENLRWATLQNVNDAFHRFARMIDDRFTDTISATHGAIQAAFLKRKEHSEAISDELARTELAVKELSGLIVILRR
ncbi:MAG: Dynamin family protein, partial [Desulfomonilaceae bacterium]